MVRDIASWAEGGIASGSAACTSSETHPSLVEASKTCDSACGSERAAAAERRSWQLRPGKEAGAARTVTRMRGVAAGSAVSMRRMSSCAAGASAQQATLSTAKRKAAERCKSGSKGERGRGEGRESGKEEEQVGAARQKARVAQQSGPGAGLGLGAARERVQSGAQMYGPHEVHPSLAQSQHLRQR